MAVIPSHDLASERARSLISGSSGFCVGGKRRWIQVETGRSSFSLWDTRPNLFDGPRLHELSPDRSDDLI